MFLINFVEQRRFDIKGALCGALITASRENTRFLAPTLGTKN